MEELIAKITTESTLTLLKPEAGLLICKTTGLNFLSGFLIIFTWSLLIATLEYFSLLELKELLNILIRWIVDWITEVFNNGKEISEKGNILNEFWNEKIKAPVEEKRGKLLNFALHHNNYVGYLLFTTPFMIPPFGHIGMAVISFNKQYYLMVCLVALKVMLATIIIY